MKKSLFLLGLFGGGLAAFAQDSGVPITDFHTVSTGVYRGARPEEVGLQALAEMGVKTDLNLDSDLDAVKSEKKIAKSLGIEVVSVPMSGFWTPTNAQVNQALKVLADPSRYPVFVHCQYGHDRTGLIMGLFRVENEGWEPKKAYQEMLDLGFHQSLVFLNHYFEERTGFED